MKMSKRNQVEAVRRQRLSDAAQQEFANFERLELEFRKRDRKERADELQLPLENTN
jgi:hypothetical protein